MDACTIFKVCGVNRPGTGHDTFKARNLSCDMQRHELHYFRFALDMPIRYACIKKIWLDYRVVSTLNNYTIKGGSYYQSITSDQIKIFLY